MTEDVLQVLKNLKGCVEARNSVCHGAVVFANAIMHSGTTVDTFLRENLDWLSRATNWSKFSATAGLGVIHRGHLSQACLPLWQLFTRSIHTFSCENQTEAHLSYL